MNNWLQYIYEASFPIK